VGHSFGGMIANLILRGNDPVVAHMAHAITVGTPFYGYAGQLHRWFEGEQLLNGVLNVFKKEIVKVISSFPSLYTVLFLDEATYNNSIYPVLAYPSMDATIAGLRADPYNPQTNGSLVRYPANTGFDRAELDYGRLQFQQMAAPMAVNLSQKFYNICGVRTVNDTVGSVTWDWIRPNFNPLIHPSPIADAGFMPGDDTQPAWTACLATNDPIRCIAVTDSNIEHMFLMNHAGILNAIASILCA